MHRDDNMPHGGAPAPDASAGQAIEAALEQLAVYLQANDLAAAVTEIDRLSAACHASARTGIDEGARMRLQPLVERCVSLAGQLNAGLAATLAQLGAGNRAHRAYNAE